MRLKEGEERAYRWTLLNLVPEMAHYKLEVQLKADHCLTNCDLHSNFSVDADLYEGFSLYSLKGK
jgi:hypothetical protein